jgi:Protein chain release factor A
MLFLKSKQIFQSFLGLAPYSTKMHSLSSFYFSSTNEPRERKPIVINEKDLEWKQVRGSGPGGQATNKTSNCAVLLHKPTGIVVKAHDSRDFNTNKHYAIKRLKEKLDIMINGDLSKKAQEIEKRKKQKENRQRKSKKKYEALKNAQASNNQATETKESSES